MEKDSRVPLDGIGLEDAQFLHPTEKLLTGIRPWTRYVGYAVSRMVGAKIGLCQKSEEKLIYLPGPLVEHWRTKCQEELEQRDDKPLGRVPILSKMDVITAWFLHVSSLCNIRMQS